MELGSQTERSPSSEGDIKPRHEHFFKTVASLEFQERVVALVAIPEHSVGQVRYALGFAEFDGFCDQGIGGPFVVVTRLWKALQYGGDVATVNDFQQTDQFPAHIGAKHIATVQKR
ncbi:MAG TPA: hypothetical protein VEK84_02795 [Terriglobales bacterium]|nr:hypothetical protein [Terriglobales bacterium]